jgi:hypothetical protein
VVVVLHKRKCVQSPAIGFDRPPQPVEPFLSVSIIQDNVLSDVPPGHDVIERARKFNSQRSCHALMLLFLEHGASSNRYPSSAPIGLLA